MTTMLAARTSRSAHRRHHLRREEGGSVREQVLEHAPVMLDEALQYLDVHKGDVVVDATYGRGGHSAAIAKVKGAKLITIDADPSNKADITGNFADIKSLLAAKGVHEVNKVLFDLGWNMTQLQSGRGFSFMNNEPLVMSYGEEPRSKFTAAEMLNVFSETALADIFYGYGEERYAKRIAKVVVTRREIVPFATTFELVEAIRDAVPAVYRHGRLHPATRTFQALRIAVNDELGVLEQGLRSAWEMLAPGGRIVVITFHSTEDRVVKNLFKSFKGTVLTKKPIPASKSEISNNPASRSAKLRAIEK